MVAIIGRDGAPNVDALLAAQRMQDPIPGDDLGQAVVLVREGDQRARGHDGIHEAPLPGRRPEFVHGPADPRK